jgi:cytosine/adenosine deaminase-related metal-dependent hydrolase
MAQTLIKGATLVTLDKTIGDFPKGDLLIDGAKIKAIAPSIDAPNATIIDGAGRIVIPGLVNAHMHTWQTALRGVAANWTLIEYFHHMHAGLATKFTPDDLYIATLMGGLNQINCGTTTLGDWCHNNPTPDHTDRAIDGLIESGIRATFFHGSPKPDPKPGQKPFWEMPHPRSEVERLAKTRFSSRDQLVNLGLAILGPHYSTYDVAVDDFRLSRDYGLIASMHCAGPDARTPDGWDRLRKDGLLGDNNNIVHGQTLTEEQLRFMLGQGVTFSLTPETELAQGHGFAITGRLRKLGAMPSLGVDLESMIGGDMLTVARVTMASQRGLDNDESRRTTGKLPPTSTIHCREALEWITIEGAKMLKQNHRIGSLTPGKQADIVVINADDLNMWPIHDPVTTVITQTSLANIEHVLIDGEFKKRNGKLLYPNIAERKRALSESGRRILTSIGLASAA